ncbi:2-keto-4-pentenoate hydratase [Marinobacterium nitratireducens]|uniref:2-keto-4-pentenoate hydratase n=1 Tax=Marinobacterium nitratireducens TaxID=518897 RepID=A0A917ZA84_9GAMM|nr:fumarylacetoacetate hydrolase family protein [Marinobacterium nitratireducens]GGO78971.1 2-keto-4-pentenoate hydratase [Marinobacterium nitratireducens]
MLNNETRQAIAQEIYDCYRNGKQISLLTKTYPEIEQEDSYRIQEQVIARFIEDGRKVKGYKIGLTSKAMQEMAGTTEPDYSVLTDDMFVDEEAHLNRSEMADPLVEIEIAFVMKERLQGPGINAADVIRATDFVLPSIEVVDFRVARAPGMDVRDTIADMAAVGKVVLGGNPVSLNDIDVRKVKGELLINDEVIETGMSSAVLGNPVTAVAWLANKLADFGVAFEPGDVIFSGSCVRALPVQAGDVVTARFDNGLGDVVLNFD